MRNANSQYSGSYWFEHDDNPYDRNPHDHNPYDDARMGCEDHSIAPSAIAQSGSPSKLVKRIIFLPNSKRHRNLIIVSKWLIYGKLTVKRQHACIVFRWKKTAIN
jgi:hypothetical protein